MKHPRRRHAGEGGYLARPQHQGAEGEGVERRGAGLGIDVGELDRFAGRRGRRQCLEGTARFAPFVAQQRIVVARTPALPQRHQAAGAIRRRQRAWLLGLALDGIGAVEVHHQRQVEHVEPDHRPLALVTVFVPQAGRRQDQVAVLHRAHVAADDGARALAFDDDARRVRRMAVVGRRLARQHQLHAKVDDARGLQVVEAAAGIRQHQHAPLGLFHRRQLAGAQQEGADGLPAPLRYRRGAGRAARRQQGTQAGPQRHQVGGGERLAIFLRKFLQGSKLTHDHPPCRRRPN